MFFITPVDENGSISENALYPDAVSNFTPLRRATQNKYTLSNKESVSTHRTIDNDKLNITLHVGEMPLNDHENNMIGFYLKESRPQLALKILNKWFDEGTELLISNKYDVYTPFTITSLLPQIIGDSIRFNLSLEKVRRVSYAETYLLMENSKKTDAKRNEVKGKVKKKKVEDNKNLIDRLAELNS